MKALVGAFNQEMALVGAFSVIVKLCVIYVMGWNSRPVQVLRTSIWWTLCDVVQIFSVPILYRPRLMEEQSWKLQANCWLAAGASEQSGSSALFNFHALLTWIKSSERGHRKFKQPLSARCLHQFSTKSAYSEISPPLLGNQKNPGAVFSQCVAMNKCPGVGFNWDILLCWHIRRSKDFWFNIGLIPY